MSLGDDDPKLFFSKAFSLRDFHLLWLRDPFQITEGLNMRKIEREDVPMVIFPLFSSWYLTHSVAQWLYLRNIAEHFFCSTYGANVQQKQY